MAYDAAYFELREDPRERMRRQELERVQARTCRGGGALLGLFPSDRGQGYGVEVSEHARKDCRTNGTSFEPPSDESWCDLVVLRGSLQHLDRPIKTLATAHRWLREGGWLVALAAPSAVRAVYRLFQEPTTFDPPRNYVVFSDRILTQCLRSFSFRGVEFVYPYRHGAASRPCLVLLRLAGVRRSFAFSRNMVEAYARK